MNSTISSMSSTGSGEETKVVVRVRKLLDREGSSGVKWKVNGKDTISCLENNKKYTFDRVFNPDEGNETIYRDVGWEVIESAVSGFNSTIFAYGQTASGKTHTMMGSETDPGIIRHAISHIFDAIEDTPNKQFLLRVSYMEIYNEKVTDLLAEPKDRKKNLKLSDDAAGVVTIEGLREVIIHSPEDVFKAMDKGEKLRHVGETNMNERSSRSHTIFRLILESSEKQEESVGNDGEESGGGKATYVSHLNLVDLAGSERASQTGAVGDRLKEGSLINNSLMVLGTVIRQLSEGGNGHIPFRDSKLTRILKNSLGGNTKTAIVCTVTPAEITQTKSTLEFAARAKKVVQHAHINEILDERAQMNRLKNQIKELTDQLSELKGTDLANMNEMLVKKNADLLDHLDKLKKQMLMSQSSWQDPLALLSNETKVKNDRRMTWCPAAQTGNGRRRSFGGLLRLQRFASAEQPKVSSPTPSAEPSPASPEMSRNISTRRKRVQFLPIAEEESFSNVSIETKIPENVQNVIDESVDEVRALKQTILGLQAKLERDADHRQELEATVLSLKEKLEKNDEEVDVTDILEAKIEDLEMKLSASQAKVASLESNDDLDKIQDLEERLKTSDSKKEELQIQIEALEKKVHDDNDASKVKELEDKLISSENAKDELHAQIEVLKNEMETKLNVIDDHSLDLNEKLEQEINANQELSEKHHAQIKQLEDKLSEKNMEVEDLKKKLSASQDILEGLESNVDHDKIQDLEQRLKTSDCKKEELQGQIEALQRKLLIHENNESGESKVKELENKLIISENVKDELQVNIEALKKELETYQRAKVDQSLDLYEKLETEINANQELSDRLHAQIKQLEDDLSEKNLELALMQADYKKAEDDQQATMDSLNEQCKKLQDSIKSLEIEKQALSQELAEVQDIKMHQYKLEDQCLSLDKMCKDLQNTVDNLKEDKVTNLAIIEDLEKQKSDLLSTLEKSNEDKQSFAQEFERDKAFLEEIPQLKEKIKQMESDRNDLLEMNSHLDEEKEALSHKLNEAKSLIEELEASNKQIESANMEMQAQIDILREEKQSMDLENVNEVLVCQTKIQELEQKLKASQDKHAEDKEQIEALEHEKQLLVQDLAKIDNMKMTEGKLEEQCLSLDKMCRDLQNTVDSLKDEKENNLAIIDDLEEQKSDLLSTLEKSNEEKQLFAQEFERNKVLLEEIPQLTERIKQMKNEQIATNNLVEELEISKKEVESTNAELLAQLEVLREEKKTMYYEIDDKLLSYQEKIQELEQELKTSQDRHEEYNDQMEALEREKQLLEQELANIENIRLAKERIEEQCLSLDKMCKDLQKSIHHLQEDKENHLAIIEDLEEERRNLTSTLEKSNEDKQLLAQEFEQNKALIEKIPELTETIKQLESDLNEAQTQIDELKAANHEIESKLDEEYKEYIKDIQSQTSDYFKEIQRLKALLENVEQSKPKMEQLEENIKQLQAENEELMKTNDNQYVKEIRDKLAQEKIQSASLRVDLKRAEGEHLTAVKRHTSELDNERAQVKRLKEEIRRMSTQKQSRSQDLDSTYVARPPLAEKPIENKCTNCQNISNQIQEQDVVKKKKDDDFMHASTPGIYASGCSVANDMFLEQAKRKVTKLQDEMSRMKKKSDLEISHYLQTAQKWKTRTLNLQDNIKTCPSCVAYVEDYSKK